MSTVRLKCDDCDTVRQGVNLPALRLALERVGWNVSSSTDTDLCPVCVSLRRRPGRKVGAP